VGRYVDLLADLRLLRRLPPWSGNLNKRLVKAPKIYIRDSGIVHALLELETLDRVVGHPVVGASYEGMVLENLIQAAGERRQACYLRTQDGAEIDLIFERGGRPELAVEIKRSSAPALDRGCSTACDALGIDARYVVYPGEQVFPLRHGAQAIPLAEMVARLGG
jgi:predicted AAA+ superfamily ATPase